ncbi:MAG TPA: SHOCT domain-containing protein [Acidimicrobiales bacterium]|nr:SHOCT domain-containing protein [Acidimicrobiales bacterium]
MLLAAEFGTGQVLWSMLYFFLFFIWIMILFQVFADLFRSDDLSGWAKAAWLIFVIFLPYLGVFVYLIARGHKMGERQMRAAQAQQDAFDSYVREAAGSSATELAKLSDLHDAGKLTDEEFASLKAKILA